MFNPSPRTSRIDIGRGQTAWVLDDALLEPERMVELAVQNASAFRMQGHNAFPGPELPLSTPIASLLDACFARHVRTAMGLRRTLRVHCRLSMVTLPPHALQPRQWLCHRDRLQTAPGQRVAASVLYLFDDASLGGTRFFAPCRPPGEIEALLADAGRLAPDAFADRHGLQASYITGSNRFFEHVGTIPPRKNRLVFYDGDLFHSGDIASPERLHADPARGRLTLNGFFTCRPAAT